MSRKDRERQFLKLKAVFETHGLGRAVAEQDNRLAAYYIDTGRYVSHAITIDDPIVFFIGPKGVGKSAILQMVRLTKSSDTNRLISISPDDLAFSALANVNANTPLLTDTGKNQWLFKTLWDYILTLEVLRREYRDRNRFTDFLSSLFTSLFGAHHKKEARRLLQISIGDDGQPQSLSARILQLVKEIEISAEVTGTKLSGKAILDNERSDPGNQLALLSLINSVAKKLHEILSHPYYILIDDLDLHWQDTPVQNAFIAALFFSLRNFSRPPYLKCAVAIRDQIYRRLPLVDRDKYDDWICHVEWDADSVRKIVEKRLHYAITINHKDIWGGLFPTDAFMRMWKHSFGRPRELIRLCTLCIKCARNGGHSRIEEEDLKTAIREFSTIRIDEVASEWNHKYPGLEFVIRKFLGWHKEFPFGRISSLIEDLALEVECKEEFSSRYTWTGGFINDPKGFARILLECGVLLIKASRTAPAVPYDTTQPQDITDTTHFVIHPTFAPGLGLVGSRD